MPARDLGRQLRCLEDLNVRLGSQRRRNGLIVRPNLDNNAYAVTRSDGKVRLAVLIAFLDRNGRSLIL
jgi:hypothetical protein